MEPPKQPTKEQIRHYMQARQAERCAPPPVSEIRRQLGWDLAEASRGAGSHAGSAQTCG